MEAKVFEKLSVDIMSYCIATLNTKGEEYSREGDRLWNFKRAGMKTGETPAQALMGMKVKHDVSVDDIVDMLARGQVPSTATMFEKIGDSINYLLLLAGLIEEARELYTHRVEDGEARELYTHRVEDGEARELYTHRVEDGEVVYR